MHTRVRGRRPWGALALAIVLAGCSTRPAEYSGDNPPRFVAPLAPASKGVVLGIALGSGGRRGFAHVGVVKALHAAGVCPAVVTGTSIGAFIGALYAGGASADRIERLAIGLDPFDLVDIAFSRHGWFRGDALERFVDAAVDGRPIERLARRFAAVATRVPDGEAVVFNQGATGAAVRASSAVPGSFLPLRVRGEIYMDGDLASPVPVGAARTLGAGVVIAVDVSADLATTPSLDDIPVEWIATGILRKRLIDIEVAGADIVVRPRLPYYAGQSAEYRRMAIEAGETATRAALATLRERFPAALEAARC